jgi:succinoglycan biosynthesis protein ExoA
MKSWQDQAVTSLDLPAVSYVMPVLNEEDHLEAAVRTILAQDYPGQKEIVLALGPSRDRSNEIAARLAREDSRVRLVQNPARDIPIGLNLAIDASNSPVVVRVDAHSELAPDYTRLGVETMLREGAHNVGGIMRAAGHTPLQRAIARGYNSSFGLGGGAYHGDGTPGPAESAYLGIFRRDALLAAGGYDPTIRRGEDWELNLRIRRGGGLIWFDPQLGVTYWPRARLSHLAQQFFATGTWRAVLVRKYGGANPWRFFVPGSLVIALLACAVLGILQLSDVLTGSLSAWLSLAYIAPIAYLTAIVSAVSRMPGQRGIGDRLLSAVALVIMHVCWGSGFLVGIVKGGGKTVDRSRT